ncbi:MAG: C4-dicarboxylate ABC transporter, partial [Rhodobacteraceae bacterium]|nr:C4-dicarboxylate ABC transporter [Paracoccaceae bacterium]
MINLKGKFAAFLAVATLAAPATAQAEEFINILTGGTSGV